MSALQTIRNPSNKSGQKIIRATLQAASEMKSRGIPILLNGSQGIAMIPEMMEPTDCWRSSKSEEDAFLPTPSFAGKGFHPEKDPKRVEGRVDKIYKRSAPSPNRQKSTFNS
jgi:hypothetical protein